jgi:RimJ/RimL family protein N-acetyltransferase
MRHELSLAGAAFGLRPVRDEDAAFIVGLRSDPELGRYLHPTSPNVADQLAWLARYYERPGDYYFVIERLATGAPEGLIGVYDIEAGQAEWGRWLLKPGSLAAVESAALVYRCAFELLQLDAVYCRTVAANERVVSFHDSCGIAERRLLPGHFELHGERVDAVEHRLTRDAWPPVDARLTHLAQLTARRLQRGA